MFKRLAVIALLGVLLLSAKTYTFNVSDQATVGSVQIKPGEYSLKLDGAQAVLTDKAGNRIDATATVETAERKFGYTAITVSKADGTNRILSVQLGGTRNTVVFQ